MKIQCSSARRTCGIAALTVVMLAGLFNSSRAAEVERFASGPFEIITVIKRIGAGGFPNTTANPFARTSVTNFTLKYKGKLVVIAGDGAKIDSFLDAWSLDGATEPAVLLASGGVYLVSEARGELKTQVLSRGSTDMASIQWLDARSGQPAAPHDVSIRDARGTSHNLSGGKLLLINRERVLDLATLRSYAINLYDGASRLDDFSTSNGPARALSPGKSQYVLVGERSRGDQFEHALIPVDFARNHAYAVPFDMAAMRIQSAEEVTPDFVAHYFQWTQQADGERLAVIKNAAPLPWRGRLKNFGGGAVEYHLMPVLPKMMQTFMEFLQREFAAQSLPQGADPNRAKLTIENWPFNLWFQPQSKELSLYAEASATQSTAPAYAIIQRIARRFDDDLAKGQYQSEFAAAVPVK
jgi:hypothetical protein